MPGGRPSLYTPEIGEEICRRLTLGETLIDICRSPHIPDEGTVRSWLWRGSPVHAEFVEAYARAREAQMERWADEIVSISDDCTRDDRETESGHTANTEWIARSRLRVDTRKFLMSKIAPRLYGDKLALTGADGGAIKTEDVGDDRALARRVATLLTKGALAAE